MALKVNLLPPEYAVTGTLSKVLGITRTLGVIMLAAFLILGLGLAAFFVISSIELNNLKASNDNLKSQILAQAKSEQEIVLLKDRIKKIKTSQSLPSSIKNLTNVNPFISTLSASSSLTELSADSQKVTTTVNFKSNSDLTAFVKSLTSSNVFKSIVISSFGFNPASGYLMSVSLANK